MKAIKKTQSIFDFEIENFIPEGRKGRVINPELIKSILTTTYNLEAGQSFFINNHQINQASVRRILREELKKKEYKNCDIRVMSSKNTEIKGCRVCRIR